MFRCRFWTRCLFTFTKLATSQSRCGVSSLDKASTTSRSELIPKRVKPCTASSLAVTVFSSAAVRPGPQSAPAAHIRTDRDAELQKSRLLSSPEPASRSSLCLIAITRCVALQSRKAAEAFLPRRLLVNILAFRFRTSRANRVLVHRSRPWWRALDRLGRL